MRDEIIQVLMTRDGCSEEDATDIYDDCVEQIGFHFQLGGDLSGAEAIVRDILGLEPDYVVEFIPV